MLDTWHDIQLVITALGGILGGFIGGFDGFMYTLVAFMIIDYVTGFMLAALEKKLSSEVGFKGIFRKMCILMLVGVANLLDVNIIGQGAVLRTMAIFFYLSNEGLSILENVTMLGLPVPDKLRAVLEQLRNDAEQDPDAGLMEEEDDGA